jgi:hypothetical protein
MFEAFKTEAEKVAEPDPDGNAVELFEPVPAR